MKNPAILFATATLIGGAAVAGGIESFPTDTRILFENGKFVELGLGYADGKNSGTKFGAPTGDITPSRTGGYVAYKQDIGDRWVVAIRAHEPIRYRLAFPAGTGVPSAGTTAEYLQRPRHTRCCQLSADVWPQ